MNGCAPTTNWLKKGDYSIGPTVYFGYRFVRPVESHSGARGNILAGPPNIFTGLLWEEDF